MEIQPPFGDELSKASFDVQVRKFVSDCSGAVAAACATLNTMEKSQGRVVEASVKPISPPPTQQAPAPKVNRPLVASAISALSNGATQ
jgi:hypothetical protein